MPIDRVALTILVTSALAPATAVAQQDDSIGRYLQDLQRQVEEHAPGVLDDARRGIGAAEIFGRNLVDRWRVCDDGPQSAAPVCRVLTDGEGGALDPSPGSLDRVFERLDAIAAPYNDRSRSADALRREWAEAFGIAPERFSAARAVRVVFDRIEACPSWPCEVLDRNLLDRTVGFLLEQDTEGHPAAQQVRAAYHF